MTKDEARDAAWAWMDSRVDGTLGSNHDYFDNGFDAGYDFAKSNDKAVIDDFLMTVRERETFMLDTAGSRGLELIDCLDGAIGEVYAEMFGKEGDE